MPGFPTPAYYWYFVGQISRLPRGSVFFPNQIRRSERQPQPCSFEPRAPDDHEHELQPRFHDQQGQRSSQRSGYSTLSISRSFLHVLLLQRGFSPVVWKGKVLYSCEQLAFTWVFCSHLQYLTDPSQILSQLPDPLFTQRRNRLLVSAKAQTVFPFH